MLITRPDTMRFCIEVQHDIRMIIDNEGYIHIIEYLTEHLCLFENSTTDHYQSSSVLSVIESELSEQIMSVCGQNKILSFNQRNTIIRECDAIVHDLQEILSGVINKPVTQQQHSFISEFASLIKNLFDTHINSAIKS